MYEEAICIVCYGAAAFQRMRRHDEFSVFNNQSWPSHALYCPFKRGVEFLIQI
jgi:hypothetical protein